MKARDNPFGPERILQLRYRLDGITWSELLARCEALRYRAALIGPHGFGKTTLLEDLELRLRKQGFGTKFIRLDAENRSFKAPFFCELFANLTANDIVLFDGAEQLNFLSWLWFRWRTRHARGLIITTHQQGRLPTLWQCTTTPALLLDIGSELLGKEHDALSQQAHALFEKHRGNLREALREWYDLAASTREFIQPAHP